MLRDVLDGMVDRDKSHAIIGSIGRTTHREYFLKQQGQVVLEPVNETEGGKAHTIKAQYYKNGIANFVTNGGFGATAVAEPVPLNTTEDGKAQCIRATCYKDGIRNMVGNDVDRRTCVAQPICHDIPPPVRVGSLPGTDGEPSGSQAMRIYSTDGKSVGLKACGGGLGGKTGLYAVPAEGAVGNMYGKGQNGQLFGLDSKTKTLSAGTGQSGNGIGSSNSPKAVLPYSEYDGKPVYEVADGQITIKDRRYPIKLADGLYTIRKLTVEECKRLQTVPDDFDMSVISDTQAYKCLGNGWTVDVIIHLIRSALADAGADDGSTEPLGRRCPVCDGTVTDQYRVWNSMEPGTLFRCDSCHRYFRTILRECREDEI